MPYSEQSLGYVAYKVQSAKGTPASGASGKILRTTGGPGGRLTRAPVESNEVRPDAMSTRGRHGINKTSGSYDTELSLGNIDDILEATMRGTWSAASFQVTEATVGGPASITTTANTIVGNTGSWITAGLRVNDVIRMAGHATAGNNNRNLRITGLTATVITVAETLTLNAVADTAFTITRTGRVLINPAAGSLVQRYFTIEEYETNIDASEIFPDVKWGAITFAMSPNGMFTASPSWAGTGQFSVVEAGSAPSLTAPTIGTGIPMAAIDATLRLGTGDQIDVTSFSLTIDATPASPDVAASNYGPDVFMGSNLVSMNLSMLRADMLDVADFNSETQMSLSVLVAEPGSDPKSFINISVPNFTLGSVDKSPLAKAGGPRTQTIAIPPALVGIDTRGGAFDSTMIKFQVSNAS